MSEDQIRGLPPKQVRFLAAYRDSFCNKAKACRDAGISRQTLYLWLKDDAFRQTLEQHEWEDLQNAEHILKARALAGNDIRALTFFLQRKHPDYGKGDKSPVKEETKLDDATTRRLAEWRQALTRRFDNLKRSTAYEIA